MKRIYVCLLIFLCFAFVQAQKIKHPALLYTPERIQQVKQRIVNDLKMAEAWASIKKTADEQLQKKNLSKADYLALAYLMTDEKKYADKLKEILLDVIKEDTWGSEEMLARIPVWRADLGLAHKAYLSAIAYDAVYNDLSSSERKEIAEGLKRLALDPCLGDWVLEPARIHSLNSMGHNWWTSCACMGGILALSLQNELPEQSKERRWYMRLFPNGLTLPEMSCSRSRKALMPMEGCMKVSIMPISGFRKHYSFVWHG